MNQLERRYRRLLRLLPAGYRQAWEEDMVATFLAGAMPADPDDAEFMADYGRPEWSEVASVVGLAVRLRLGGTGAAWGEAVRLVALMGLLFHAVIALAGIGSMLWQQVPLTVWAMLELGWVAAYLALVDGQRRAARLLAGVSLVPVVVNFGVGVVATGVDFLASRTVELLVGVVPVVAMAAFHREAPPVRPRPWLIALPVSVVVVTAVLLVTQFPGSGVYLDQAGLACVAVFLGGILVWRRDQSWVLALALLAVAALILRAATLLDYLQHPSGLAALIVAAVVEGVVMLLVAVPLAVRATRSLRLQPAA